MGNGMMSRDEAEARVRDLFAALAAEGRRGLDGREWAVVTACAVLGAPGAWPTADDGHGHEVAQHVVARRSAPEEARRWCEDNCRGLYHVDEGRRDLGVLIFLRDGDDTALARVTFE